MTHQYAAGCVVFTYDTTQRKYLLVQNVRGNHWEFPKGRMEPGETTQEAALRELKEETNIEGKIMQPFEATMSYTSTFDDDPIQKTVYFFIAQAHSTDPVLSHEHGAYGWFSYEDALKQLTYINSQEILTQAHDFLEKAMITR